MRKPRRSSGPWNGQPSARTVPSGGSRLGTTRRLRQVVAVDGGAVGERAVHLDEIEAGVARAGGGGRERQGKTNGAHRAKNLRSSGPVVDGACGKAVVKCGDVAIRSLALASPLARGASGCASAEDANTGGERDLAVPLGADDLGDGARRSGARRRRARRSPARGDARRHQRGAGRIGGVGERRVHRALQPVRDRDRPDRLDARVSLGGRHRRRHAGHHQPDQDDRRRAASTSSPGRRSATWARPIRATARAAWPRPAAASGCATARSCSSTRSATAPRPTRSSRARPRRRRRTASRSRASRTAATPITTTVDFVAATPTPRRRQLTRWPCAP